MALDLLEERLQDTAITQEELNNYSHKIIQELSDKFDVWYGKFPETVIDTKKGGHYKKESNKIVLKTLTPEEIYKLAGYFLFERHNPEKKGASLLNRFFRLVTKEAVGSYCAKLGNKNYDVEDAKEKLYSEKSAEKKDDAIVKKIMSANLDLIQASRISNGLKTNKSLVKLIEKLKSHISEGANFETLAQNLGAVFGNELWEQGREPIINQLPTEKISYFEDFFNVKSFLSPLEEMYVAIYKDMRKKK